MESVESADAQKVLEENISLGPERLTLIIIVFTQDVLHRICIRCLVI